MEKDQQEFIQAFAAISGAQDQKTLESKIQELGEQGISQLYQVYQQVKDKGEQGLQILKQAYTKMTGGTYAKLGAKLNYINQLRGKCPEGTEAYKAGGCIKCRQKQKEDVVDRFKSEKCGGKVKQRIKKDQAGGKTTKSYSDETGNTTYTRRIGNQTFTKTVDEDGNVGYKGYNGVTSTVNPGGSAGGSRKAQQKADSLVNAWNKGYGPKAPKKYFGGLL